MNKKSINPYLQCIASVLRCNIYHQFYNACSPDSNNNSNIYILKNLKTTSFLINSRNMPEITLEDFRALRLDQYAWIHFEVRPVLQKHLTLLYF